MDSMRVRCLILLCSLVLVLPPGWCCMASHPDTQRAEAKRCCGCSHCQRTDVPTPVPKPPPVEPFNCPCFDRNSTPPSSPKPLAADAIAVGPRWEFEFEVACVGSPRLDQISPILANSPRHLVYCTWLC